MGAATYVGRIGALAISLGVGVAVATGCGVASATTDAGSPAHTSSAGTDSSPSDPSGAGHRSPARSATSEKKTNAASVVAGQSKNTTPSDVTGNRLATTSTAPARSQPLSDGTRRISVASSTVVQQGNAAPSLSTELPTADQSIVATPQAVVDAVLSPFAGTNPISPPADNPASWMLLAAARREFVAAGTATSPSYDPTIGIQGGVVTGSNTGLTSINGNPLTYTVVSGPTGGGKVTLNATTGGFTFLPYASDLSSGSEQFSVLAAETTPFDAALTQIPLVGLIAQPVLLQLHQVPIVNTLLAPLIGAAAVVPVTITPSALNPSGEPIAYTVKVTSFDGTQISTNWFPAVGLTTGGIAPTMLNGPGGGETATIDASQDPMLDVFRGDGYNVVTWDPRGVGASSGVSQLDNAQFEGRDVMSIIDYMATLPATQLDNPGDPRMGMWGVSFGGGIQLVAAAIDPRIDAIAPQIAWNNLPDTMNPYPGAFRTSFVTLLALVLATTNVNPVVFRGVLTGDLIAELTQTQLQFISNAGVNVLANRITAPTLLIQGTVDTIFPLPQALLNQQYLTANGVDVKMMWFCGGHGTCLTDPGDDPGWIAQSTLDWMNKWVKQEDVDTGPSFEWVDQNGKYFSSDDFPSDPSFHGPSISTTGTGGLLPIIPLIGGSGPSIAAFPLSLTDAAPASNALNIPITNPAPSVANPTGTTQVVGAPTLTMEYSGVGTGRVVYAQIVDKKTGLVLGNQITPVPVTLDGQAHTVTVALNDVAYTMDDTSDLELQIVSFSTAWANFTQFGAINVSDVQLEMPTAANAVQEFPSAVSM